MAGGASSSSLSSPLRPVLCPACWPPDQRQPPAHLQRLGRESPRGHNSHRPWTSLAFQIARWRLFLWPSSSPSGPSPPQLCHVKPNPHDKSISHNTHRALPPDPGLPDTVIGTGDASRGIWHRCSNLSRFRGIFKDPAAGVKGTLVVHGMQL